MKILFHKRQGSSFEDALSGVRVGGATSPTSDNFHRRLAGFMGFALDFNNSGGLLVLAKHHSGHKQQRAGGRFE